MGDYDFVYVHTDIPEGMTIREWRAQRADERATARDAERAKRRGRLRGVLRGPVIALARATRPWLTIRAPAARWSRRPVG